MRLTKVKNTLNNTVITTVVWLFKGEPKYSVIYSYATRVLRPPMVKKTNGSKRTPR